MDRIVRGAVFEERSGEGEGKGGKRGVR